MSLSIREESEWYQVAYSHLYALSVEYEIILFEGPEQVRKYRIDMIMHIIEFSARMSDTCKENAILKGKKLAEHGMNASNHLKCQFHLTALAHLKALHSAYGRMEPPDLLAMEEISLAIFLLERSIYSAFESSEAQATIAQAINSAAKIVSFIRKPYAASRSAKRHDTQSPQV